MGERYARDPDKKGKDWHPPSGMHLMRGEVLAWNYVHIVMDAIYLVEETLKSVSASAASVQFQAEVDKLRIPIPERALYLSMEDGKQTPICYTNYEPHFNPSQLLSAVVVGIGNGTDWVLQPHLAKISDDFVKYGYKDLRPFYEVSESLCAR